MTSSQPGGKRLLKSKSGLKMVFQHDREVAPWDLAEPPWVPDEEASSCLNCSAKFDFLRRKHHCRRCGKIFCSKCCSARVQLHRMGFIDPVRHCVNCATVTKGEADFFDNEIKTLFHGAAFHVSRDGTPACSPLSTDISIGSASSSSSVDGPQLYYLKLSSDQRSILFDSYESSTESDSLRSGSDVRSTQPVDMSKIVYAEVDHQDSDKKDEANTITLHVKVPNEDKLQIVKMAAPPEPSRKPSVQFICALHKGLQMLMTAKTF